MSTSKPRIARLIAATALAGAFLIPVTDASATPQPVKPQVTVTKQVQSPGLVFRAQSFSEGTWP